MLTYFIFLGIVMTLAAAFDKKPRNRMFYFLIFLVMVLFAGLRSDAVGTDSGGYARTFLSGRQTIEGSFSEQFMKEPGFYYLNELLGKYSKQYWVLFTGIAALTYFCVLKAIRLQTDHLLIPLFVYITLGLYTFVFNAARQGIAVGIYMLAFPYLFKDFKHGFPRYCLFVLLAAIFHKTVIITLPLYFLFRLPYSFKIILLNALGGVIIGAELPMLFSFAEEIEARYSIFQTQTTGGEMLTLFYVLISAFFILWRPKIDSDKTHKYDVFLNMMIFGTLIFVMVQLTGVYIEATRFAAYFQVAALFLWSLIYQSDRKPSFGFSFLIVIGHLIYFTIFCTKMGSLTPYTFNPEIL